MTPNAARAIAHAIETQDTYAARTTIRRDDCHVWTTYNPVARRYDTLARVPADVLAAMAYDEEIWTDTAAEAKDAHDYLCRRVEQALGRLDVCPTCHRRR